MPTSEAEIPKMVIERFGELIPVLRHVGPILRPRGHKTWLFPVSISGIPLLVISSRIPASAGATVPTSLILLLLIIVLVLIILYSYYVLHFALVVVQVPAAVVLRAEAGILDRPLPLWVGNLV